MFHGKVLYNPNGKAGEYSEWAANFYNGCTARCEYCFNRHGRSAKLLGADVPTLKKSLVDEHTAFNIFHKELYQNFESIQKSGLHIPFVSDPCLKETIELTFKVVHCCVLLKVPVTILTKQTWWINGDYWLRLMEFKEFLSIGFTLTGHDELEPGAGPNLERINAMQILKEFGFKVWASIEPIIDFESSAEMIYQTDRKCDLYKIGLQSGKHYNILEIRKFIEWINEYVTAKVYFKDSILKQAGIKREDLPENCVSKKYKLINSNR
jgi:DNA repair photolyase